MADGNDKKGTEGLFFNPSVPFYLTATGEFLNNGLLRQAMPFPYQAASRDPFITLAA